ncbi:MAG TPA: capsule assembly Wzi family protein, partial [bacterium]
ETVMFTGRSFEPAYLNPVMFFRSAEHYLGSPDNMMMGVDFKLTLVPNFKFYGELLIDDITTTKLGTDWYGNKFGTLTGIFFAEPIGFDNFDVTLEYVRLRPYVYTHENSLAYTHYATTLGHWIGPNSDLLNCIVHYQLTRQLAFQGIYQRLRHGKNAAGQNNGGSIEQYWSAPDDYYPKFLGGNQRISQQVTVQFSYEVLRSLFFEMGLSGEFFESHPADGAGIKTNSTILFGAVGINY